MASAMQGINAAVSAFSLGTTLLGNKRKYSRTANGLKKGIPLRAGGTEENIQAAGGKIGLKYKNSQSGLVNKRRASGAHLTKAIVDNMTCSIISRWQYFNITSNPYNQLSTSVQQAFDPNFVLSKSYTTEVNPTTVCLPVFCFNLSSLAFNSVDNSATTSVPFYRLQKYFGSATPADVANYQWTDYSSPNDWQLKGIIADGIGRSPKWQTQRTIGNGPTTGVNNPRTHDQYLLDWAHIDLAFSANMNAKVHVSTVSFNNRYAGPKRFYTTDGVNYKSYDTEELTTTNTKPAQTNKADMWWDKFLSTKTMHPLRSIDGGVRSKAVKFHTDECICLMPNGGDTKSVFRKTLNIPFHQVMKCDNVNAYENAAALNIINGAYNGWPKPVFNSFETEKFQTLFPKREDDVWLMIWAENFEEIHTATGNILGSSDDEPRFDIVVTQKCTYSTL